MEEKRGLWLGGRFEKSRKKLIKMARPNRVKVLKGRTDTSTKKIFPIKNKL